jgi:hypothetical protein
MLGKLAAVTHCVHFSEVESTALRRPARLLIRSRAMYRWIALEGVVPRQAIRLRFASSLRVDLVLTSI